MMLFKSQNTITRKCCSQVQTPPNIMMLLKIKNCIKHDQQNRKLYTEYKRPQSRKLHI